MTNVQSYFFDFGIILLWGKLYLSYISGTKGNRAFIDSSGPELSFGTFDLNFVKIRLSPSF